MNRGSVERKCILEGVIKPLDELLRFVMIDNTLLPDFNKKLPGKGIYVTNNRSSLEKALEKKLFNKVTRHNLKIDDNFIDIVEKLIKSRALNSINIARKAGILVAGFEKVKEEIQKECDSICDGIKDLWFVPSPFMNIMIDGGIYEGAKYNNFGLHGTGVATAAANFLMIVLSLVRAILLTRVFFSITRIRFFADLMFAISKPP